MREELKKKLAVLGNRDDLAHIESLLDREGGFCLAGQMAIVDMIIDLQEYLTIEEMLKHCEAEWAQNWGLQAPSVRGSPAAEGNIGIQNIVAVETFYFAYQLTSQLIGIPVEVPDGPFNVATRSSVYRFGEPASSKRLYLESR